MGLLNFINKDLAKKVGDCLGIKTTKPQSPINKNFPADANQNYYQSKQFEMTLKKYDKLSMANTIKNSIKTRQIAFLIAIGVDAAFIN